MTVSSSVPRLILTSRTNLILTVSYTEKCTWKMGYLLTWRCSKFPQEVAVDTRVPVLSGNSISSLLLCTFQRFPLLPLFSLLHFWINLLSIYGDFHFSHQIVDFCVYLVNFKSLVYRLFFTILFIIILLNIFIYHHCIMNDMLSGCCGI